MCSRSADCTEWCTHRVQSLYRLNWMMQYRGAFVTRQEMFPTSEHAEDLSYWGNTVRKLNYIVDIPRNSLIPPAQQKGVFHQHRTQQNCRTCIRTRRLLFTDSTTKMAKQDRLLWTGTFSRCKLEKSTVSRRVQRLTVDFISVDIWTLRNRSTVVHGRPSYDVTIGMVCREWTWDRLVGLFVTGATNSHQQVTVILHHFYRVQ
jgi:hypothetical protein